MRQRSIVSRMNGFRTAGVMTGSIRAAEQRLKVVEQPEMGIGVGRPPAEETAPAR